MKKAVLAYVELRERETPDRLVKRWSRLEKKLGIMDEIRGAANREPRKSLRIREKSRRAERRRRIELKRASK